MEAYVETWLKDKDWAYHWSINNDIITIYVEYENIEIVEKELSERDNDLIIRLDFYPLKSFMNIKLSSKQINKTTCEEMLTYYKNNPNKLKKFL